uniref:Uncharacterized protein n=1 Tax=Lepeophtheirus salmonis TaxID=72036 RepID=A0A0K2UA94_LEPSM
MDSLASDSEAFGIVGIDARSR